MKKEKLTIADRQFKSRLIVGTGKYKSMRECAKAIDISISHSSLTWSPTGNLGTPSFDSSWYLTVNSFPK